MGSRKERSRRHRSRDKHRRRRRRSRSRSRHSRSRSRSRKQSGGMFSRLSKTSMPSMFGCTLVVENQRDENNLLRLPVEPDSNTNNIEIYKEGGIIKTKREKQQINRSTIKTNESSKKDCFKKKIETVTQKILNSKYNELKIEDILNSFLYFKVTELYSINNTRDRNSRQITEKKTYDKIKGFLYYYIGDSFKDLEVNNIMNKINENSNDKKDMFDKIFKLLNLLNEKSKTSDKNIYLVILRLYQDIIIFIENKNEEDLNNYLFEKAYKDYLNENFNDYNKKIPYTYDPKTYIFFKNLWTYTLTNTLLEGNDDNTEKIINLLIETLHKIKHSKNIKNYSEYINLIWSILDTNFNNINSKNKKLTSKLIKDILIINKNSKDSKYSKDCNNVSLIEQILNNNDMILYLYNIIKDNEVLKTIIYCDDKIACKIISLVNNNEEIFKIVKEFIQNKSYIDNLIQCLINNEIEFEQEKLNDLRNNMKKEFNTLSDSYQKYFMSDDEKYEFYIEKLKANVYNDENRVNVNSIPNNKLRKEKLILKNIEFNNDKLEIKNETEMFKIKNINYKWNVSNEDKCKKYNKNKVKFNFEGFEGISMKNDINNAIYRIYQILYNEHSDMITSIEPTITDNLIEALTIILNNGKNISIVGDANKEEIKNNINISENQLSTIKEIIGVIIRDEDNIKKVNYEDKNYTKFQENINIFIDNVNKIKIEKFRFVNTKRKIDELQQLIDEYNSKLENYLQIDNKIYIYKALNKPFINEICDKFIFQFNIDANLKTNLKTKNYNLYYSKDKLNLPISNIINNNKIERNNYEIIEEDNNVIVTIDKKIMNEEDKITFYFLNYEKEYSKNYLYVLENNENNENKLYLKLENIDIKEKEEENKLIVNNIFNTTNTENFPKENLKEQSTLYRIDGINKINPVAGISPDDIRLEDKYKKQAAGKSRKIRKRLSRKYATRRKSSRDRSRKERYLLKRERLKLRVERKKLEKERRRRSRK